MDDELTKKKDYLYLGLLGFTCWFTWQLARKSMSTNFKDKVFKELFEQVLRSLAVLVQKY